MCKNKKKMIGAIVFILSLLVLGFCVISPETTQRAQTKAMNAFGRSGVPNVFNNLMAKLADNPSPQSFNSADSGDF